MLMLTNCTFDGFVYDIERVMEECLAIKPDLVFLWDEAYMAHTSTSPNYQILASLDLGRRQAALEGLELVQKQVECAMNLRDAIDNRPLLSQYMRCLTTADPDLLKEVMNVDRYGARWRRATSCPSPRQLAW